MHNPVFSCENFGPFLSSFCGDSFPVDIREIKEVRRGISSKDFDRSPDYSKKLDPNNCLVVFYGLEFKLKTLSCVGKSKGYNQIKTT